MDHTLTEQLKVWLETPKESRDLEKGATFLLQLTGNKIMYQNVSRNLSRNSDIIEYQLQKYYNFRVKDLTHKQVMEMDEQVAKIVTRHFSFADSAEQNGTPSVNSENKGNADSSDTGKQTSEFRKGKREDHDSLPVEIQAIYVENNSIMQKMRELHLQLRMLSTANAVCPDSERYPFLKEIIELDKTYHKNWEIYDHFVPGESEIPVKPTDEMEESKSALRVVNLMKGRYKKNPSDELKAKILDAYSKVLEPSEKLKEELTEMGILTA